MKKKCRILKYFGIFVLLTCGSPAIADTYPDRDIKLITPYAPGGGTDILFRILAPKAGEILGKTIIIENKPGASTLIGTGQTVRSKPDGYTLLAADSAIVINPGLYGSKLPYDTQKDLQAVTMLAAAPTLLVVNPNVKATNLKELIALVKSEPGKLNYASGGIGAATHLAGELFKLKTGADIVHVPYNGTTPGLNAVVSGDVQMSFAGIGTTRQLIENGRLRAIAVTGEKRNPAMPNVPTFLENGLEINASSYWGLYAPSQVSEPIVDIASKAFSKAVRNPENVEKLTNLGYTIIGNSPEEHRKLMTQLIAQWADVIDKAGIVLP